MQKETISTTGPTTSFQIGPDPERDVISAETLLMKLASIELLIDAYDRYALRIAEDGLLQEVNNDPPDNWALIGAKQNLEAISHALKCGCFGYQWAMLH